MQFANTRALSNKYVVVLSTTIFLALCFVTYAIAISIAHSNVLRNIALDAAETETVISAIREVVGEVAIAAQDTYLANSTDEATKASVLLELQKLRLSKEINNLDTKVLKEERYSIVRDDLMALLNVLEKARFLQQRSEAEALTRFITQELTLERLRVLANLDALEHTLQKKNDSTSRTAQNETDMSISLIALFIVPVLTVSVAATIALFHESRRNRRDLPPVSNRRKLTEDDGADGEDSSRKPLQNLFQFSNFEHGQPRLDSSNPAFTGPGTRSLASEFSSLSAGAKAKVRSLAFERLTKSLNKLRTSTEKKLADSSDIATIASNLDEVSKEIEKVAAEIAYTFKAVDTKSYSTSKYVSLIDDIASQIHILSLNIKVEADRTGREELTLTAAEVQKLAASALQFAKEVRLLIVSSNEEDGGILIDKLDAVFAEVVVEVQRMGDFVLQIAAAARSK